MTSPWSSPFKDFGGLVGVVSSTLKNAEKAIDKAIGIPEDAATQNGTPTSNRSSLQSPSNGNNNLLNTISNVHRYLI
jgi:hypothetical protein